MNARLRQLLPYFCAFLFAVKLLLSAEIPVSIVNSPNDDLLYVSHAHALLEGNGFGPYTEKTLLKLPGFSFVLALFRLFGIPYAMALSVLFALAGYTFIRALGRCGFSPVAQAFVFTLYLFHPITLSAEWGFVLREPLSTCLFIFLLAFLLNVFVSLSEGAWPWLSDLGLAVTMALLVLTREEETSLYATWAAYAVLAFLLWKKWHRPFTRDAIGRLVVLGALPLALTLGAQISARAFIFHYYGIPILHELSEGEYPKLVNELRRVRPQTRSLHEIMTPAAIDSLLKAIPGLKPLFASALAEMNVGHDEGSLLFRFREQAARIGYTPSLPAAQKFYEMTRGRIAELCRDETLDCAPIESGFFPKWRASDAGLLWRQIKTMARITIDPHSTSVPDHTPSPLLSEKGRREYQQVTLMPDAPDPFSQPIWRGFSKELFSSLVYWARYPDVASSAEFGPTHSLHAAKEHFDRLGNMEHRQWVDGPAKATVDTTSAATTAIWRDGIRTFAGKAMPLLCLIGIFVFLARLLFAGWSISRPFGAFLALTTMTIALKVLALSYVSVYLTVAVRLLYPAHLLLCAASFAVIADTAAGGIRTWRRRQA